VDLRAAAASQRIGRRSADIAAGDRVIAAGDLLSPSRIRAIAAIGRAGAGLLRSRGQRSCRPGTK
jgi:molybdopterin biosynthesis enzyme